MKIILDENYYIDSDKMNYILINKYVSVNKDGIEGEHERTVGFFPDVISAVYRYISDNQKDMTASYIGKLEDYCQKIYDMNRDLYSKLNNLKVLKDDIKCE